MRKRILEIVVAAAISLVVAGCGSSATDAGAIDRTFVDFRGSEVHYDPDQKVVMVKADFFVHDANGNGVRATFWPHVQEGDREEGMVTSDDEGRLRIVFTTTHLGPVIVELQDDNGNTVVSRTVPVEIPAEIREFPEVQYDQNGAAIFAPTVCLTDSVGPVQGKVFPVNLENPDGLDVIDEEQEVTLDQDGCFVLKAASFLPGAVTVGVALEGVEPPIEVLLAPPLPAINGTVANRMGEYDVFTLINPRVGLFWFNWGGGETFDDMIDREIVSVAVPREISATVPFRLTLPVALPPEMVANSDTHRGLLFLYDDLDGDGAWQPSEEPFLGMDLKNMMGYGRGEGWMTLNYAGVSALNAHDGFVSHPGVPVDSIVELRHAKVVASRFRMWIPANKLPKLSPTSPDRYDYHDLEATIYIVEPSVIQQLAVTKSIVAAVKDVVFQDKGLRVAQAPLKPAGDEAFVSDLDLPDLLAINTSIEKYFIKDQDSDYSYAILVLLLHNPAEDKYWLLGNMQMGRSVLSLIYTRNYIPEFALYMDLIHHFSSVEGEEPDPEPHTFFHDGWNFFAIGESKDLSQDLNQEDLNEHNTIKLKIQNLTLPKVVLYCGDESRTEYKQAYVLIKEPGDSGFIYLLARARCGNSSLFADGAYSNEIVFSDIRICKGSVIPLSNTPLDHCTFTDTDVQRMKGLQAYVFDFMPYSIVGTTVFGKPVVYLNPRTQRFDAWTFQWAITRDNNLH